MDANGFKIKRGFSVISRKLRDFVLKITRSNKSSGNLKGLTYALLFKSKTDAI